MVSNAIRWVRGMADNFRATKEPRSKEQILETLRQTVEYGEQFSRLAESPSFKIYQESLKQRFEELNNQLQDPKTSIEVVRCLQAQLTELKFVLGIVPTVVEQGERAQERITEMLLEKRHGEEE